MAASSSTLKSKSNPKPSTVVKGKLKSSLTAPTKPPTKRPSGPTRTSTRQRVATTGKQSEKQLRKQDMIRIQAEEANLLREHTERKCKGRKDVDGEETDASQEGDISDELHGQDGDSASAHGSGLDDDDQEGDMVQLGEEGVGEELGEEELAELDADPEADEEDQVPTTESMTVDEVSEGEEEQRAHLFLRAGNKPVSPFRFNADNLDAPAAKKVRLAHDRVPEVSSASPTPHRTGAYALALRKKQSASASQPSKHKGSSKDGPHHSNRSSSPTPASMPLSSPSAKQYARRPRMQDLTPSSQRLVSEACTLFRGRITLEEPFPETYQKTALIKSVVAEAAAELEAYSRLKRMDIDPEYRAAVFFIVGQRDSQVRGEVKRAGQSIVGIHYKLDGEPAEVRQMVDALTTKGLFHFKTFDVTGDEKPKGPFENSIISKILYQQWFSSQKSDGHHQTLAPLFNPVPKPTIALICTVIECALRDWASGIHDMSGNNFTYDEYMPVYKTHLATLQDLENRFPARMDRLFRELYANATRNSRASLGARTASSYLDDDVEFDD